MLLAIKHFGLPGAAAVWAMRLILEAGTLAFFARKTLVPHALTLRFMAILVLTVVALFLFQFEYGMAVKALTAVVTITIFAVASWKWVLEADEREQVRKILNW
jgi:cell division protein FtsW (lipid II flippase)